jgi:hypothetical protein
MPELADIRIRWTVRMLGDLISHQAGTQLIDVHGPMRGQPVTGHRDFAIVILVHRWSTRDSLEREAVVPGVVGM